MRDSAAEQDPALIITPRDGRAGEKHYKTFNIDDPGSNIAPGWLYMQFGPAGPAIFSRLPDGTALGILPLMDDSPPPGLLDQLQPLSPLFSPEEKAAFETRPVSNAAGGFTASRLSAGACVALVGDAACSPPPAGQGINHALEAAAILVDCIESQCEGRSDGDRSGAIRAALERYNERRLPDEEACECRVPPHVCPNALLPGDVLALCLCPDRCISWGREDIFPGSRLLLGDFVWLPS